MPVVCIWQIIRQHFLHPLLHITNFNCIQGSLSESALCELKHRIINESENSV